MLHLFRPFVGVTLPQLKEARSESWTLLALVSFEHHWFGTAASLLRGDMIGLEGEGVGDVISNSSTMSDVLAWFDAMHQFCDGSNVQHWANLSKSGKLRAASYKMESLLLLSRVSGLLRNDHKLRDVVKSVGVLLKFPRGWMDEESLVPSPSTLFRARFTLDMAYNLLVRNRLRSWIDDEVQLHITGLWDSSPRDGREWMFGELCAAREDDLEVFCECMDKFWEQRNRISISGREQVDLMKKMQGCIWHIILQPACLGAKCMSLADKWHAAIFQLCMISDGWAMTNKLTKFMVNNCSDLGTEKSLAKPEFDCNKLYPWWSEAGVVDDVAGDVFTSPKSDAIISMRSSLTTMGLEHTCHNAEEHVTRSLPSFKMCFVMASNLGKFLGSRFCKKRMEETIFSRHEAEWVRGEVAGFCRLALREALWHVDGLQRFRTSIAQGPAALFG